jgi:putative flippase GtrA
VPGSPAALLDRITRGKTDKLVRFGMVSVVGVVVTQGLLVLLAGILNVDATLSNLIAVSLSSVPVFLLNKRWVWGKGGRSELRREVLPFWGFTLLGLAISTALVVVADHLSDRTWPVLLANISGFGIVWLAKFLFLDSEIWGEPADAE